MATPAQTQVTLDASQFISSVDAIGNAITAMNANLSNAGTAFNNFAASTVKIENELSKMSLNLEATVNGLNALFNATQKSIGVQQQMAASLTQVAASSERTAKALEQLGQAGVRAGRQGAEGAKAFTFAWDGIARLLAVTVIRRLFLDIAGAIHQSVQASADYQEQVGRIIALNQQLGISADQLSAKFANISLSYGRSLKEVADAGRIAATSGGARTAEDIDAITNASVRLAEVTGSTAPATATAITAVTRAFQLTAAEALNVSNQLVHVASSGISIDAIGPSLGRVSGQAQRLGVNFSELGLLMETIKATGVSDTEVMTQIAAALNSIERPSRALQQLWAREGIFNPQQAIQAGRLSGTLRQLAQDTSDENIQARQALQSRRAGGTLNVADEFAQRSRNNPLENVNALQEGANAALRVVDATGRWNDELEKIKTTFQTEVAPAIIKTILDMFEPMGGLAKVVTDAGRSIALIVDPIARVVSWFAVWSGWLERTAEILGILDSRIRTNADAMRAFAEAAREGADKLATWQNAQRQLSQRTLQEGTQSIANIFTPINAALSRQAELQRERVHNLSEEIEASSKQIFSAFGSQIEVLETVARQAESRITDSLKRVSEFADKTDKDMFAHRLKSAGDVSQTTPFTNNRQQDNAAKLLTAQNRGADNQIALVRDRRRRLEEEIATLQARGDANSIESARRKFEQLRQLNDQEMDIRQGSARRNAEFTARATGADQTFNPFNREREAGARRLNAAEEAFEAANRRRLAAQQEALARINRQLRDNLLVVQNGQRDIGRLPQSLLTPEGTPRQNFQGREGAGRAVGQINRTIDDQIAGLQRLPAQIEAGIVEALRTGSITQEQADQARRRAPTAVEITGLIQQLEGQRTATTALFQNAEARRVSEALQREAISVLQAIARNTEAANQDLANNTQAQRTAIERGIRQVNGLSADLPSNARSRLEETRERLHGDNNSVFRAQQARGIADQLRDQLIPASQRALTTAQRTNDSADVRRAVEALQAVVDAQRRLGEVRGGSDPNNRISLLNDTIRQLTERLVQVPGLQQAAQARQGEAQAANEAIRNAAVAAGITPINGQAGAIPATTIQQSITAFENLATALNPTGAFPNALSTLATNTATAARQIAEATANLQRPNPPRGPNALPPGVMNNAIEEFAEGGLIGNTFSSFGPDNTMIHARRGEFVVNPEDTRKWYSTLVAINRGDRPRGGGYAHGGTVSSNIGTMNFNVNGAEHPEKVARSVMKIIRREQRRGNV